MAYTNIGMRSSEVFLSVHGSVVGVVGVTVDVSTVQSSATSGAELHQCRVAAWPTRTVVWGLWGSAIFPL